MSDFEAGNSITSTEVEMACFPGRYHYVSAHVAFVEAVSLSAISGKSGIEYEMAHEIISKALAELYEADENDALNPPLSFPVRDLIQRALNIDHLPNDPAGNAYTTIVDQAYDPKTLQLLLAAALDDGNVIREAVNG